MTQEEFIRKLENGTLTGDDLLNLPFNMNKMDLGRILVEFYYMLLDCSECTVTDPVGEVADNQSYLVSLHSFPSAVSR